MATCHESGTGAVQGLVSPTYKCLQVTCSAMRSVHTVRNTALSGLQWLWSVSSLCTVRNYGTQWAWLWSVCATVSAVQMVAREPCGGVDARGASHASGTRALGQKRLADHLASGCHSAGVGLLEDVRLLSDSLRYSGFEKRAPRLCVRLYDHCSMELNANHSST